tara:strand:- start:443 stop:1135 length:693 start_codon:yes stop_codon:yes gene_type:complete
MELVRQMREVHGLPHPAVKLITVVCRDRSWEDVVFRTENGITEFYTLLDICTGYYIDTKVRIDVGAACGELVRTHHSYIVHNEQIQTSMCHMTLKLAAMRDAKVDLDSTVVDVLRVTLRGTTVPFCLYTHENLCADNLTEIYTVLSEVVFAKEPTVLHQWPNWRPVQKEGGVMSEQTCPITLEPLVDGIIASDGHLYERSALLMHMVDKKVSPMTREYLDLQFVPFTNAR